MNLDRPARSTREPSKGLKVTVEILSYLILFGVCALFFLGVYVLADFAFHG